MKRLLFVDDESNVLQGLKRLLRPLRNEWEMSFVQSGSEALSQLDEHDYDVLITDMRMPDLDGTTLLGRVREQHPGIIRIVLSGHSDNETTMRMVGLAHQYLSKPCDPAELKRAIDRTSSLHATLDDKALRGIVARVSSLPSPPEVYQRIMNELQDPDASIKRIVEIIAQDAAMTAKMLQLVNSSFFGLSREITSPEQAATLLGLDTLRSLVLTVEVFSQFERVRVPGFSIADQQTHSVQVGALAKQLAITEKLPVTVKEDATIAGLLHDVGKLVLAQNLTAEFVETTQDAIRRRCPLWESEMKLLGATHAEVGAYILGIWGLPDSVVEAVTFHHRPADAPIDGLSASMVVHLADVLMHEQDDERSSLAGLLEHGHLTDLGLAERLSTWRELAHKVAQPA